MKGRRHFYDVTPDDELIKQSWSNSQSPTLAQAPQDLLLIANRQQPPDAHSSANKAPIFFPREEEVLEKITGVRSQVGFERNYESRPYIFEGFPIITGLSSKTQLNEQFLGQNVCAATVHHSL